jgi:molecular chaperone Hsp33
MAPKHRVQGLFRTRDRRGQLVADAHPDGGTRGLLSLGAGLSEISLVGGTLEMVRTLYTGELHRGLVRIPRDGGISQALMTYMARSEQVASMIAVACVMDGAQVRAAGGYIVQLLPEVDRGVLAVMTERLRDFERIDRALQDIDAAPGPLMDEILYGMPFTRLEESALSFKCRCDRVRVMSTLASLGRTEIGRLLEEGDVIELSCDYCNREYAVHPQELRGLLEQS